MEHIKIDSHKKYLSKYKSYTEYTVNDSKLGYIVHYGGADTSTAYVYIVTKHSPKGYLSGQLYVDKRSEVKALSTILGYLADMRATLAK